MTTLGWIVGSGLLMSVIALVGGVTLLLDEAVLRRLVRPLVAFAAGTLLGGAWFHVMRASLAARGTDLTPHAWCALGFVSFFCLEQFLHWHHCHRSTSEHATPLGWLILIADGIHDLVGGLAVGSAFVADVRLGIATWLAAAAHEVPQELGDFGVLIHGGWPTRRVLLFNFLSALTFPVGGVLAWFASPRIDLSLLLAFAAGNFVSIAAADLIPEIRRHEKIAANALHVACLAAGMLLLWILAGHAH